MRLLVRLRARSDAAYDNCYHHKLRGRIWQALEGTEYDQIHDEAYPKPFTFSNPFPPGNMSEGDERTLLVASPDEELLTHIAENLQNNRELNVGEMPFTIGDISVLSPDVGEPGSTGTIETGTGVLVRIPPWRFDEYDIDTDHDQPEFWVPEHTMEPFRNQITANLDKKHNLYAPDYIPGPADTQVELFENYELIKTFALPVTPTQGVEETWILSKWKLGYRVRDDKHRRHLNLALDVGIGERNSLGFGFVNITDFSKDNISEGQNALA